MTSFLLLNNSVIYTNGEFKKLKKFSSEELKKTYDFNLFLYEKNKEIEYCRFFFKEHKPDFNSFCPKELLNKWLFLSSHYEKILFCAKQSKINVDKVDILDLFQEDFLKQYCEIKIKIIDNIFEKFDKPKNYQHTLEIEVLLKNIEKEELKLNPFNLAEYVHQQRTRKFISDLKEWRIRRNISYDQFRTITGRLTTKKNSFPILTLDKHLRCVIEPKNDYFLELDFNAAEPRVLLSLTNQEQPKEDIHQFNAKKLNLTREEAKKDIFLWLYGGVVNKERKEAFEILFKTGELLKKYNGSIITTPFDREIKTDDFHRLNYLIQSTTSDMVLRQVIKLSKYLEGKRTKLFCIIHDALFFDVSSAEYDFKSCRDLIDLYSNNYFGFYPVVARIGKNLGNMEKV